jgi:hypothetical protein
VSRNSETPKRNIALDFTRSSLLLLMFLYHSIDQFQYHVFPLLIENLRFVSGGFIFVAGFVISNIYRGKYGLDNPKVFSRLLTRGLKLIVIFSALNVMMNLVLSHSYDGRKFDLWMLLKNFKSVYVFGANRIVSFDILLPIAYLFIVFSVVLYIMRVKTGTLLKPAAVLIFLFCSLIYFSHPIPYNIRFLLVGLYGAACGFINTEKLDKTVNSIFPVILGASILNFLILRYVPLYYPVYTAGILLNSLLLYGVGLRVSGDNALIKIIFLLGRYSLITYILHIGLIAIMLFMNGRYEIIKDPYLESLLIFTITTALMIVIVTVLDTTRKKFLLIDRLYRLLFA